MSRHGARQPTFHTSARRGLTLAVGHPQPFGPSHRCVQRADERTARAFVIDNFSPLLHAGD
jgi:hypothetical protein